MAQQARNARELPSSSRTWPLRWDMISQVTQKGKVPATYGSLYGYKQLIGLPSYSASNVFYSHLLSKSHRGFISLSFLLLQQNSGANNRKKELFSGDIDPWWGTRLWVHFLTL